jgi:hypothetical protein
LSTIFAEQHVADAALDIHRRAMRMPVEKRYEFLSHWVLPGVDHATLRMQVDFSPMNLAPPVDFGPDDAQATAAARRKACLTRSSTCCVETRLSLRERARSFAERKTALTNRSNLKDRQ